jgi:hypothetical protein
VFLTRCGPGDVDERVGLEDGRAEAGNALGAGRADSPAPVGETGGVADTGSRPGPPEWDGRGLLAPVAPPEPQPVSVIPANRLMAYFNTAHAAIFRERVTEIINPLHITGALWEAAYRCIQMMRGCDRSCRDQGQPRAHPSLLGGHDHLHPPQALVSTFTSKRSKPPRGSSATSTPIVTA